MSGLTGKYSLHSSTYIFIQLVRTCDLPKLKIEASSSEDEKLLLMEIQDSHLNSGQQDRKVEQTTFKKQKITRVNITDSHLIYRKHFLLQKFLFRWHIISAACMYTI